MVSAEKLGPRAQRSSQYVRVDEARTGCHVEGSAERGVAAGGVLGQDVEQRFPGAGVVEVALGRGPDVLGAIGVVERVGGPGVQNSCCLVWSFVTSRRSK